MRRGQFGGQKKCILSGREDWLHGLMADIMSKSDVIPTERFAPFLHWIQLGKAVITLAFLVLAFILAGIMLFTNFGEIDSFVKRILRGAVQLSIADVISINIPRSTAGGPLTADWVVFYRVKGPVKLVDAVVASRHGSEFIEIEAESAINLSGGFVGDGDEIHHLDKNEKLLRLKAGERIRIYTWVKEEDKEAMLAAVNKRIKATAAKCQNGTYPIRGIYQSTIGDRIVLVDAGRNIILDMDYWPVDDPKIKQFDTKEEKKTKVAKPLRTLKCL